jgi:outer membrane receptor protein involved in Fe transport
VVVHPFHWLSLSWSDSNSEQVAPIVRRNLDGSLATFGSGTGKEYGVTVRWKDRLSLRVARYESTSIGNLSSQRSPRPTPTLATKGNIIRNDIANIENTVRLAGAPLSQRFAYYTDEMARQLPNGENAGAVFQELFELLSDQVAKGYEATLIGNPTPNWRVSVGVARNESSESNIGTQHFEFIKERLPVWASYGNRPLIATPSVTIGQLLPVAMQTWNYIRQSEGLINPLGRKYRVTATTRYGFSAGRLKGVFLGSTYVWRSPAAVGFLTKTITDNEFATPGVSVGPIEVNDLSRPVRGGPLTSFDGFLGYSRRVARNKLTWRVQLNVRNLLNDDDLLVQRALSTGQGAIYTAQQPRSFILTNSFEF